MRKQPAVDAVVFDLGGVLIDWNPRHLYRKLFAGDDAAMEHFLAHVCTMEWHRQHDAGRPFAETRAELKAQHPSCASLIDAFGDRHDEMFGGPIEGSVAVLERLAARNVPLYALTNFPAETFPLARQRFSFLARFRDIVVSGVERVVKPDPEIFRILFVRTGIDPRASIYVDDSRCNVETARKLDMHAIHFASPAQLEDGLITLGLLAHS